MKAFPTYEWQEPYKQMIAVGGMDLRDYFAAKAMQGMASNPDDGHNPEEQSYEEYIAEIVENAYEIADAMMRARKK